MGMNLPKWSFTLLLIALASFALADGNGVNSYNLSWTDNVPTDADGFWGVNGPFDFDADGLSEVLTYTDTDGLTLYLYENAGDNAWELAWSYALLGAFDSYDCADQTTDLDGDGIRELIVGGSGDSGGLFPSLFIFELDTAAVNAGGISFDLVASLNPAEVADIPSGGPYATSTKTILASDLDGDGVTELLHYDGRTHTVSVMSLDPESNFDFPNWIVEFTDNSFCCSAYGAVVGDFDNNGTNNFAMVEWDYNGISFFDVLGEDDYELIQFTDDVTVEDGGSLRSLAAADFNADSLFEIILASTSGDVLIYSVGEDLADFDATTDVYNVYHYEVGFSGAKLGNTDIWRSPSDGPDLIIATDSSTILDLEYVGGVGGDPTDPASWMAYEIDTDLGITTWQDVTLGDFDRDGLDEIYAVTTESTTSAVYEHAGWNLVANVDVRPTMIDTTANPATPGAQTRGVAVGSDLDGDGRQEVIITDYAVYGVHVYEVAADNTLEWMTTLSTDSTTFWGTPRHVITGDLDNDGKGEIIYMSFRFSSEAGNGINVWEWDGVVGSDNYIQYVVPVAVGGTVVDRYHGERTINVGDPDNDGQQEILISNNGNTGATYDIHMIAHIDGDFESGFYSLVSEWESNKDATEWGGSPGYGQANVTDLDGDGDKEVCFFSWNSNTMLVVESTGEDSYEIQTAVVIDSALTDKAAYGTTFVTDIDGDGSDEIYGGSYDNEGPNNWLWQVTGGDDAADISFENGDVNIIAPYGAPWDVTGGDGDGDGVDEIYSVDYGHGRIYQWDYEGGMWNMTVVSNFTNTMGGFGLDFANDLDGDGHPELVQGFLEPAYTSGNPYGYIFSVSELGATVGVDNKWTIITPDDYKLRQNYPNPFNPSTTIEFTLPLAKDNISVIVYNMLGQEVVRLADNASYGPGTHSVTWNSLKANGSPAAAGVYIYELRSGNVRKTAKMTLVK